MKTITFHNWSDRDFSWTWGGEGTTFKAGSKVLLPDYLANHFAKHFIDRELTLQGLEVSHFSRAALLLKTLIDETVEESGLAAQIKTLNPVAPNTETETKVEAPVVKKAFCDSCDSKGVKHKNGCPKQKKVVEEVFEGLEA